MRKMLFLAAGLFILGCSKEDDGGSGTVEPPVEEQLPVAVDDQVTTAENTTLTISGLLENDTVFEFARITEVDSETAEGGSVRNNRDGTFTYTPPQDYIGEDSFEYTMCDNASTPNCSTATVNITITAASPVAADDSYETQENKVLRISTFTNNDELLDNATVASINTDGTSGTVVLGANGAITYTPQSNFAGEDSFTYTICDDDETPTCSTATITVNVVDEGSPEANDDTIIVDLNQAQSTITGLLANDDLTDDASITAIDDAETQGTVVLNSDGSISYSPPAGFSGEDTFTYSLCDDDTPDATCSTATVTLNVLDPVAFDIPAAYEDYYEGIVFSTNDDFNFRDLSRLTISEHSRILSYGERHEYLYEADEDLSNEENVILMYTGESRYWREYASGNNSYSPQTFNTEHIYPQSLLTAEDAVTDLHHLRVADEDINSLRLNHPFADGSGEAKKVGENAWYPGDEWKGDVARMIMYLNIRYGETFDKVGSLDLFLEWNREDPVSAFEMQRQEVIYGAQGNRNPFIDNPYLATLLWGGEAAENTWD